MSKFINSYVIIYTYGIILWYYIIQIRIDLIHSVKKLHDFFIKEFLYYFEPRVRCDYVARNPPSMGNSTPLIMLDLSLRRNTTAFTTSDTSPNLKMKLKRKFNCNGIRVVVEGRSDCEIVW